MTNRRMAIKTIGFSTASVLINSSFSLASSLKDIGLQLYTVRNLLDLEFEKTIKSIGVLGFQSLETFAGPKGHFWGFSPGDLKNLLVDSNLKWVSMHIPYKSNKVSDKPLEYASATQNIEKLAELAVDLGIKYLVCPFISQEDRDTLEKYKLVSNNLNLAASACKKAGIGFAYHNHDFEFMTLNGETPMNVLMNYTDPELVKFEMDVYWVVKSGQNPLEWIKKHPSRFKLAHLKDMDKTQNKSFTEIGNGSIDFVSFLREAHNSGLQHYFVEQDKTPGNPLESIGKSISYLKTLNF